MGVHVVDRVRLDPGVGKGDRGRTSRLGSVRPRLDHVVRVRRRAVAHDLGVWGRAAPLGFVGGLEHEQGRPLAHDEAVAPRVERALGAVGLVVVTGRERPDDVEGPERERAQRDLAAAGDGGVDPAFAQVPERLAERDRPGGARVRGREDRAADVERDPEVGRRRAAKHREGEVRGDGLDTAVQVALVLVLGVRDATERRAEVDPDPLRVGRAVGAGGEPRVLERELARHQPELAKPIELACGLRRHPCEWVEVVHLGGDVAAERARVEAIDRLDR